MTNGRAISLSGTKVTTDPILTGRGGVRNYKIIYGSIRHSSFVIRHYAGVVVVDADFVVKSPPKRVKNIFNYFLGRTADVRPPSVLWWHEFYNFSCFWRDVPVKKDGNSRSSQQRQNNKEREFIMNQNTQQPNRNPQLNLRESAGNVIADLKFRFANRFPICYRLLGTGNWPTETATTTTHKSMLKTRTQKLLCAAALVLAGITASVALADSNNQSPPTVVGQGTNSCAGVFYAKASMTNGAGGVWITPTNSTISSGTFTNASGGAYSYSLSVQCHNTMKTWCGTNSVTFPATNTFSYSFYIYITSPVPPPTNGEPINLQVNWQ